MASELVLAHDRLLVRQQKEWGEILSGFETRNRYQVVDPDGAPVLLVAEEGKGFVALLARSFLGTFRPFTMHLLTADGQPWLRVERPWRWFFHRIEVLDAQGQRLGAVQRRWAWLHRLFDVEDPDGRVIAKIDGPFLHPWTFHVKGEFGEAVGAIRKRWSGLLKEAFTDADTFGVEFETGAPPRVRQLLLGATFLLDVLFFERKQR